MHRHKKTAVVNELGLLLHIIWIPWIDFGILASEQWHFHGPGDSLSIHPPIKIRTFKSHLANIIDDICYTSPELSRREYNYDKHGYTEIGIFIK